MNRETSQKKVRFSEKNEFIPIVEYYIKDCFKNNQTISIPSLGITIKGNQSISKAFSAPVA